MEMIKGQTAPAVWLAAVEHLNGCGDHEDFDVFLHVAEPTVLSKLDAAVYAEVDNFLTSHGAFGTHTIAETIFSASMNIYMAVRRASSMTFRRRSARFRRLATMVTGAAMRIAFSARSDAHGEIFNPLAGLGRER